MFLEVYFDDWTVFGLVKFHVASLRLMPNTYQRYQIALNLKKYLFCVPFGTLLGHVVCRQGLMVDPVNIAVILNLEAQRSVKELHANLGHTRYYKKFIKCYAQITVPMETLLKKDATFCQNEDCKKSLDVLKEIMVTTTILVFLIGRSFMYTSIIMYSAESSTDTGWWRRLGRSYSIQKQKVI